MNGHETVSYTHLDFVLKNGCASSLLTGANCTLTVTFKPTASGTRTAAVAITDGAGTQNVALTLSLIHI